jgi:hypothetical protein
VALFTIGLHGYLDVTSIVTTVIAVKEEATPCLSSPGRGEEVR